MSDQPETLDLVRYSARGMFEDTADMGLEEFGAMHRLVCAYFLEHARGLPVDPKELNRLCHVEDGSHEASVVKSLLVREWVVIDGRFHIKLMED